MELAVVAFWVIGFFWFMALLTHPVSTLIVTALFALLLCIFTTSGNGDGRE